MSYQSEAELEQQLIFAGEYHKEIPDGQACTLLPYGKSHANRTENISAVFRSLSEKK